MTRDLAYICSIVVLGIASIIFGLAFYGKQVEFEQKITEFATAEPTIIAAPIELGSKGYGNQGVAKLLIEVDDLKKETATFAETKEALLAEIDDKTRKLDTAAKSILELQNRTGAGEQRLATANENIAALQKLINDFRNQRKDNSDIELEQLRKELDRERALRQSGMAKLDKTTSEMGVRDQKARQQQLEAERKIAALQLIVTQKNAIASRQNRLREESNDGQIVEVDVDRKFAVINLGKVDRVVEGMRFDVVRWRFNRWDLIACVEITSVKDAVSTVVILTDVRQRMVCPYTGFEGLPGMKYSPYAAGGETGDRVVNLIAEEAVAKMSMKRLDPIVKGDFISNPFYSRKRTLTFTVTGEPVQYSLPELKQIIERYNAKVTDEVGVDTDYLVLCTVPEESDVRDNPDRKKVRDMAASAHEAALQYGIPIMREVDVLNVLRR